MSLNKKGFVLIETLSVTIFAATITLTKAIYQNALREFFISHEINNYTIDETCLDFFRNTFFNNAKTKEFTLKNLKKFLVDSPINRSTPCSPKDVILYKSAIGPIGVRSNL